MAAGDQPVNTGTWYLEFNVEMVFTSSQSIARYIGPGPDCQSVVTNSLHYSLRLFVKWSRFLSPVLTDPGTRCNCPQSVHLTELWQETVSLPLQTPQAVTNLVTTYQQSLTPVSTSPPWGTPHRPTLTRHSFPTVEKCEPEPTKLVQLLWWWGWLWEHVTYLDLMIWDYIIQYYKSIRGRK